MKLAFFSNFLNHHQLPFCLEMEKRLGKNFIFVATESTPQSRLDLGYEEMNSSYSFVLKSYESSYLFDQALFYGENSDIVIIGSAPDIFIKTRLKKNRITFRYLERIFKDGYIHAIDPRVIKNMIFHHTRYRKKQLYLLAASAYTAIDMSYFGAYPNKIYKWGYFPEVKKYNIDSLLINKELSRKINILWAGRLIKYKHPEYVIDIARFLKEKNIDYHIDIIGIGDMLEDISRKIKENDLSKFVFLRGAMSPKEVRNYMEKANIFLFTSDYGEGWGAVLNEAMNSGCAVVASHSIGSVPFLLKDKVNGLIYKNGDIDDLCKQVKDLCLHKEKRVTYGKNAYITLRRLWNPSIAADNFLKLAFSKKQNKNVEFIDGPCSKAISITQKRMYYYLKEKQ